MVNIDRWIINPNRVICLNAIRDKASDVLALDLVNDTVTRLVTRAVCLIAPGITARFIQGDRIRLLFNTQADGNLVYTAFTIGRLCDEAHEGALFHNEYPLSVAVHDSRGIRNPLTRCIFLSIRCSTSKIHGVFTVTGIITDAKMLEAISTYEDRPWSAELIAQVVSAIERITGGANRLHKVIMPGAGAFSPYEWTRPITSALVNTKPGFDF